MYDIFSKDVHDVLYLGLSSPQTLTPLVGVTGKFVIPWTFMNIQWKGLCPDLINVANRWFRGTAISSWVWESVFLLPVHQILAWGLASSWTEQFERDLVSIFPETASRCSVCLAKAIKTHRHVFLFWGSCELLQFPFYRKIISLPSNKALAV